MGAELECADEDYGDTRAETPPSVRRFAIFRQETRSHG